MIYFYNDSYKSIVGGKHPQALGRPIREVWSMLNTAMTGAEGTYVEEQLLMMERIGQGGLGLGPTLAEHVWGNPGAASEFGKRQQYYCVTTSGRFQS